MWSLPKGRGIIIHDFYVALYGDGAGIYYQLIGSWHPTEVGKGNLLISGIWICEFILKNILISDFKYNSLLWNPMYIILCIWKHSEKGSIDFTEWPRGSSHIHTGLSSICRWGNWGLEVKCEAYMASIPDFTGLLQDQWKTLDCLSKRGQCGSVVRGE